MLDLLIYGVTATLFSILIGFIPVKLLRYFRIFSFEKRGLRKIRRRHDHSDVIANTCLGVSVLFSLLFWLIPGHFILYGILLLISYFCLLGQVSRISRKYSTSKRMLLVVSISMMFFFGLFSALGCFNGFVTLDCGTRLTKDIFSGEAFHIIYLLRNYTPMMVLFQAFLYFIPMYCLWAQFKYMRLEDTFKGSNIGLFLTKVIFICVFMVVFAYGGYEVLNWAYYIDHVEV